MGRTFRRNSEDSYKYGGTKRPKPKPKRPPQKTNFTEKKDKDWRQTFQEINGVLKDDDRRPPTAGTP
jgi:hypothetical protein